MSMNLASMKKSRPSGAGNGGGGSENVAVMIAEIHLADKTKKTSNPAEDYAIAYLLEDAFGKTAEFKPRDESKPLEQDTEYGAPLTTIKFKLRTKTLSGDHTPTQIFDLQPGRRKGVAQPMGTFPTVILETAWYDNRNDEVSVGWLTVAQRAYNYPTERCIPKIMTMVEREKSDNGRTWQNRHVVMPESAQTFDSLDGLRAIVCDFLADNPDMAGGKPAVLVRMMSNQLHEAPDEFAAMAIYQGYDREKQETVDPAVTFEQWLSNPDEDHQTFIANLNLVGTKGAEGYTFEAIPMYRYSTGDYSLPSKKTKGGDDSDNFRVPLVDAETGKVVMRNDGTGPVTMPGYAEGSLLLQRRNDGPWFATKTFRKNRYGPIFLRDEIVTPNLPQEVAKYLQDKATKRGTDAKEATNRRYAAAANRSESQANDEEIGFGEPDQTGGLTPS